MLQYANSAYIGERLKHQRLSALHVQLLSRRKSDAIKELVGLKSDVVALREEQRQLALREEALTKSPSAPSIGGAVGPGTRNQQKRKLVYVTEAEEKSGGGGMLGGLAGSRRGSTLADAGADGRGGRFQTRMRIREGRSHRWYVDTVSEASEPGRRFLPTFAQCDSFSSFEALGKVGDLELQANDYTENFLDEIYDNLRSLKVGETPTMETTNAILSDLRRSLSTNQR